MAFWIYIFACFLLKFWYSAESKNVKTNSKLTRVLKTNNKSIPVNFYISKLDDGETTYKISSLPFEDYEPDYVEKTTKIRKSSPKSRRRQVGRRDLKLTENEDGTKIIMMEPRQIIIDHDSDYE